MEIGISTAVKTNNENWDKMNSLIKLGYKHIEFCNKITRIRILDVPALRELKKQKNSTYSFHSMVQDLFCADEIIAEAELGCLRGEIRLASLIGCNNLVFHISKKTSLNEKEIKILNLLAQFARNSGLKLCLENNFSSGVFSGDYLMEAVDKIKDLKLCLDIGHLRIAVNKELITDLDKFLNAIKNRVVQLHINFNNGKQDQHLGPKFRDIEFFEKIIGTFKNKDLLLLIETKNINQATKTNKLLQEYVQG